MSPRSRQQCFPTGCDRRDAHHQPDGAPFGYNRSLAPDRRPFPTKDGFTTVMPFTTRHWRSFFAAIGRDDLVEAPLVNDPNIRSPRIAELYAAHGLDHASQAAGPTLTRLGVRVPADHLFTRGFEVVGTGAAGDMTASDHLPVWARLRWR